MVYFLNEGTAPTTLRLRSRTCWTGCCQSCAVANVSTRSCHAGCGSPGSLVLGSSCSYPRRTPAASSAQTLCGRLQCLCLSSKEVLFLTLNRPSVRQDFFNHSAVYVSCERVVTASFLSTGHCFVTQAAERRLFSRHRVFQAHNACCNCDTRSR